MNLQLASETEIDSIVNLLMESDIGSRYFDKDINRIYRVITNGLEHNEIYAAKNDNEVIVGFTQIKLNGTFDKYPFIHFLIVSEQERNKGIGKEVLILFEEILENEIDKYYLMVGKWNEKAINFYIRNEFKIIGELENFYRKGETEILMEKKIDRD